MESTNTTATAAALRNGRGRTWLQVINEKTTDCNSIWVPCTMVSTRNAHFRCNWREGAWKRMVHPRKATCNLVKADFVGITRLQSYVDEHHLRTYGWFVHAIKNVRVNMAELTTDGRSRWRPSTTTVCRRENWQMWLVVVANWSVNTCKSVGVPISIARRDEHASSAAEGPRAHGHVASIAKV